MDVERLTPNEMYATKFEVRQMSRTDFRRKERLPIKLLNLRATEELMIHRAKKRLGIVVATSAGELDDLATLLRQRAQKHLMQEYMVVVPLYGIESAEHSDGGIPPAIVARAKALVYPHFFYCPPNSSPLVYEAIVRLDRLQVVTPAAQACEVVGIALTDDALTLLRGVLRQLLLGEEDEYLRTVRELCIETLPPEARPASRAAPAT
jgi:hypothetical protein